MKICIATSTRADWGLLSPLAAELRRRPGVELQILATNMHLMPEYGMTVDEIERQGFVVSARVPMPLEGQGEAARVRAMAACMDGTAQALRRLAPDMLVILGDRYEMLAIASAATVMTIPIAHIAGGEVSEGAIDDNIRHAITKLSALHFTATEPYRRRVIQMGEDPARVVNAGALGVWNILNQPLMTLPELEANLGFKFAPGAPSWPRSTPSHAPTKASAPCSTLSTPSPASAPSLPIPTTTPAANPSSSASAPSPPSVPTASSSSNPSA